MSAQQSVFGAGYVFDQPSPTDPVVDMSTMTMDPQLAKDGKFDLSKPEWVVNQGSIGSCTANAVATAYRYELKRQGKADFITSRLYLYYVARLGAVKVAENPSLQTATFYNSLANQPPTDNVRRDTGSNIREAVKVLTCLGAVPEDKWQYHYELVDGSTKMNGNIVEYGPDASLFATDSNGAYPPQNGCFNDAKKHFTVKYSLTLQTKDCWKMCLRMGYPIVFGYTIYTSFNDFAGKAWYAKEDKQVVAPVPVPSQEGTHGGHAVLAVGWNDNVPNQAGGTTGCFLVQNSWSADWGKGGFFWMPYEWLTTPNVVHNFSLTLMDSRDS